MNLTRIRAFFKGGNRVESEEDPPLTTNQVAEILHVHPSTIRRWSKRGVIQPSRKERGGKPPILTGRNQAFPNRGWLQNLKWLSKTVLVHWALGYYPGAFWVKRHQLLAFWR